MSKVLVFESDAKFAAELRAELEQRGSVVTVVDDANAGLQAAASDKPDLILLAIELPRMNGFSVCNKLKRDANLKDVPLIIMSSDSTEETFEQHKRLRTRAEDYVHKPISFTDLEARISAFVLLDGGKGPRSEEDAILIDDEVDFEEADAGAEESANESASLSGNTNVDAEVDQFTEDAFGALLDEGPLSTPKSSEFSERGEAGNFRPSSEAPRPQSFPPPSIRPPSAAPRALDAQALELARAEAEFQARKVAEQERRIDEQARLLEEQALENESQLSSVKAELRATNNKLADLENQLASSQRDLEDARQQVTELENKSRSKSIPPRTDELQKLQKDLDEARAKGGATARDFLELREQLNRKDKEILDLREQLTNRDKELLALRDANLAQEREKADFIDKVVELEKKVSELDRDLGATTADKEQAAKRADDFKKRSEKLAADLDSKSAELKVTREKHEQELALRDAKEAALAAENQQKLETLRAEKESALREAHERAEAAAVQAQLDKEAALSEAIERLTAEKDTFFNDTVSRLTAEKDGLLSETIARLTSEEDSALSEAKELAENDKQSALSNAYVQAEQAKADALASREQSLRQEHGNTLAALQRAYDESQTRQKSEHQAEVEQLQEKLSGLERRLTTAQTKWDSDQTSLQLIKESLGAALSQISQVENRTLE